MVDELHSELDDLRAARTRLVVAADAERRRIERELHDGAQQHLVALAVNLQLARQLAETDPRAVMALLDEMSSDVRAALDALRELAEGIYPPLLHDRGLVDALKGAGRHVAIPVGVEVAVSDRYPAEVESTVYFCCLEALENAARHGGPGARATVRVWQAQDVLHFEAEDDGAGFDQTAVSPGRGLTEVSDRLGALGGSLTIASEPGVGVRVSGTIPLGTEL